MSDVSTAPGSPPGSPPPSAPAPRSDETGTRDGDRILVVSDVARSFGGVQAVAGATLDVRRGSLTALIGPNGAGKTTLFHLLSGFVRPDRGDVVYDGHSIFRKAPYAIARRGMVRTFQLTKTLAAMPVIDNMMLAACDHPGERLRGMVLRPGAVRRREREARERALELLDTFMLATKADAYAGTLSGGQRKLLELARALMLEPRLVLLDEPMAGVNPALGQTLMDHIVRLRDEKGVTFLFIEHDLDVVMRRSERVVVMAQGRVIASGTPDEVRGAPEVIDAYLGGTGHE